MTSTWKSAAAAAALALTLTPALAHHGWSGYGDAPQQATGVIRSVQYANPHATLELEADGRSLLVVLAPPSRMSSRGLPESALKVGDSATVEGYIHRTNESEIRAEWIALGDTRTELR